MFATVLFSLAALETFAPPLYPSEANNQFADAIQLFPGDSVVAGDNYQATKEAGEPSHAGNAGGASVWFRWITPFGGWVQIDTLGSSFDTLLAVYTGSAVDGLSWVASDDDGGGNFTSRVFFNAEADVEYRVAVDGYNGDTGTYMLRVVQGIPGDTFAFRQPISGPASFIHGSNLGATLEPGEPNHAGQAGGASMWWSWVAPADGEVTIGTHGSGFDTLLGIYTGTVLEALIPVAASDDEGGSFTSQVTFPVAAGVEYQIAVDGYLGAMGAIYLSLDFQEVSVGDLGAGLDTTIPLSNSGTSNWRYDNSDSHDGTDSISARIGPYGYAVLDATVAGPGFLSFYWKARSINSDSIFLVLIDGEIQIYRSYFDDLWHATTLRIDDGAHTISWAITNPSGLSEGNDLAWLDELIFETEGTEIPLVAEAVDAPDTRWFSPGHNRWQIVNDPSHLGGDAVRSGTVDEDQSSWIQTEVTGPGMASYWWKTSSQKREQGKQPGQDSDEDFLAIQLDGQELDRISGRGEWSQRKFYVPQGEHSLSWVYQRQYVFSAGLDTGWLDEFSFVSGEAAAAPFINQQPEDRFVLSGRAAVLSVGAAGSPNLGFQWLKDGEEIPGANESQLSLNSTIPEQSGEYQVRVSNNAGSALSEAATLVVLTDDSPLELARYTFDGHAQDVLGKAPAGDIDGTTFVGNALSLNGQYDYGVTGFRAVFAIPELLYESFAVAVDFKPSWSTGVLLMGGQSYRWFGLRINNGLLSIGFNQFAFTRQFSEGHVEVGEWNRVAVSFDLAARRVRVLLNGVALPEVELEAEFVLNVLQAGANSSKEFTFTNYSNGEAYEGLADNLRVFARALNFVELRQIFLPDLKIEEVSATPGDAYLGAPLEIAWTVRNLGGIAAIGPWTERVTLLQEPAAGSPILLDAISAPQGAILPAGGAVYRSVRPPTPAPADFPAGTARIKVAANEDRSLNEANFDNNQATSEEIVLRDPRPDLQFSEVNVPSLVLAGGQASLTWKIANRGHDPIPGSWKESVYISADSNGAGAQLIQTLDRSGPLLKGQEVEASLSATIPVTLAGTYYLIIRTDVENQVAEGSGENNNTYTTGPIEVRNQDLAVQNFSASAATVAFGGSLPVSWGVRNVGTAPIDVDWVDRVYLSVAADSIAGAVLLSTQSHETGLPAGESYSRAPTLALPAYANQTLGTYYLILLSDAEGAVTEPNESNNRTTLPITLTAPPSPDLQVRTVIVPAVEMLPGASGELQWTLENAGNASATGSWNETIYVSSDGLIGGDIVAGTVTFDGPLAPGGSVERTGQFTIPFNGPLGNLYLVVRTDSDGAVVEQNEINNAEISVIPVAVPAILQLEIPVAQIAENAPNQVVQAVVSRSGPTLGVLHITATSTDPSEAAVPASVTILSGQASAILPVTVQKDGVVDGPQPVAVSVSAAGFQPASVALTVLDSDVPKLTMAIAPGALSEGQTATGTITRDYVTSSPLTVNLATTGSSDLQLPPSVIILGDLAEVTFSIVAVDDDLTESLETHSITISAVGFVGAAASISIAANDDAEIQLTSDRAAISEGDGPQAARLTVSRMAVTSQPLTIQLESSDATAAQVPRTVAIPAFKASASVPVAAVDDELVDGAQPVQISARAMTPAGEPGSSANPLLIQVEDDDGPTLKFTVTPGIVPEDRPAAAIGRVSRNTSTAQALLVALVRDALGEVSLPALVIIPAGSVYVEFPIDTLEDGVPDGDQRVTLTALADGYTSGTAVIIVTDENRPDLTISGITVPAAGVAEGSISVTYRISNEGLLAAAGPFWQRVFLSRDSLLGDDILLNQFSFGGELPPGLHIDQTVQVTLPLEPGDYWLVVATDAEDAIHETREDNNAAVSLAKIPVGNAYSARVEAAFETALSGTPVPLSGEAVLAESGLPARFVSVHIHILLRDTERILAAITDGNGQFSTTFQPLAGEGGRYRIGAAHPGRRTVEVQDEFTLIGLRFDPANLSVTLVEGNTGLATAALRNLSDIPLSGLAASVVENPVGLAVAAQLGSSSLPGLGEAGITLQFGTAPATPNSARVVIRVTSNEGAQADLPVEIVLEPLKPRLVADPSSLSRGMLRGQQTSYEFEVVNRGGAPSGPVTLLLPDFPWLRVASENPLPSLPPGGSGRVALLLSPAADLPLIQYGGTLVLRAALHSLAIPFQFRAVSEAKGNLEVIAEDEFTYFAEGSPHVAGAAVSVFDAVSGDQVAAGLTDADGRFAAADLPEGYYRVEATAERHNGFRANIQITAGDTKVVRAFMARQTVRYIWTVEEIQIEDRTQIHIETVFETFVPAPVIVVDPIYVDLSPLTSPGQKMQVNYKIANHGLIAAQNGKFRFSEHPLYRITPLIENVGTIPANSEMTVPVTIERLGDGGLRAFNFSCSPSGDFYSQWRCGGNDIGNTSGLVFGAPGCGRNPDLPQNKKPEDLSPGINWYSTPVELTGDSCQCDTICLDPGRLEYDQSEIEDINTCVDTDLVFRSPPVTHSGARIKIVCPDGSIEEKTIYGTPEEPEWIITPPSPEPRIKGTGFTATIFARVAGRYQCQFSFKKLQEPIFDELPCQPPPISIEMRGSAGKMRFVTPAGNPVKAPNSSGDGKNEYTFDDSNEGTFTMFLKAKPCEGLSSQEIADITDKIRFQIDPIEQGNPLSNPQWLTGNNGKAIYNGTHWIASAKFIGLPILNDSFGRRSVLLKIDGTNVEIEQPFELFYSAWALNSPGSLGYIPNWFVYYQQAEHAVDYEYDPNLTGRGLTDASFPHRITIGKSVFMENNYVRTVFDEQGKRRAVGHSQNYKYLPSFFATVHHERAHRMVFGNIGNSSDYDGDGLLDQFELSIGTDPRGGFTLYGPLVYDGDRIACIWDDPRSKECHAGDGELYAASVAEQLGYERGLRERGVKDWANPGSNAKP